MEERKKYGLGQWLDTLPNTVKNCISINDFKDKYEKYYNNWRTHTTCLIAAMIIVSSSPPKPRVQNVKKSRHQVFRGHEVLNDSISVDLFENYRNTVM